MTETGDTPDTSTPQAPSPGLSERIKSMSVGALIVSAVAILVVGLVVGLAAGYKIEQTRVKNDVKNAKKAVAKTKKTTTTLRGGSGQTAGTGSLLIGTVDTATPGSVKISVAGAIHQVAVPADTVIVKASAGTASDITTGSRVLVKTAPGSLSNATEVIALPADAKLGNNVVAATPTSITIGTGSKTLTVDTKGATVDKVSTAQAADITAGEKVIAQTRAANPSTAAEVVLLPKSSAFVS